MPADSTLTGRHTGELQNEKSVSHRAHALAARIEEGAALLEEFAETLTEAEWNTRISARDARTVGVVVHHVASVYPVELDLARSIASGQPVAGVSWDNVAEMNAQHAREHTAVSRPDTLTLLRRNSREAAATVRRFTDAELDRAAPFSLAFDAPMTAQFVLEDHPVRHSWHHLAKIRAAIGR